MLGNCKLGSGLSTVASDRVRCMKIILETNQPFRVIESISCHQREMTEGSSP
jgi:hypothetical protein